MSQIKGEGASASPPVSFKIKSTTKMLKNGKTDRSDKKYHPLVGPNPDLKPRKKGSIQKTVMKGVEMVNPMCSVKYNSMGRAKAVPFLGLKAPDVTRLPKEVWFVTAEELDPEDKTEISKKLRAGQDKAEEQDSLDRLDRQMIGRRGASKNPGKGYKRRSFF